MAKTTKQPKTGKKKIKQPGTSSGKIIKKSNVKPSYYDKKPIWKFTDSDKSMWQLCHCDTDFFDKLASFESMTWNDIAVTAKKQHHHVEIAGMIKPAQERLSKRKIDVDELFSLRFSGKHRMYGIIDEIGAFHAIWYDTEHEIYPSKKKNT